ncbi:MAG TPA: hypothetical protein PKX78_04300, partial [Candidatus Woesebacteria bacterium]|nr:hypothetical protein [Candidatus Woesebacteria bacterium]
TIKLTLPAGLMEKTRAEAEQIGVSVQDLIRMLLISYFARGLVSFTGHKSSSPKDKVMDYLKQGHLIQITNKQELNDYFKRFKKTEV